MELSTKIQTRFDQTETWERTFCSAKLENLETDHLVNIHRMVITKPGTVMSMCIHDLTHNPVWAPASEPIKESIKNLTSMTVDDFGAYILNSPLMQTIEGILEARGVNHENLLNFYDLAKEG